jgi:hypothetical protein
MFVEERAGVPVRSLIWRKKCVKFEVWVRSSVGRAMPF